MEYDELPIMDNNLWNTVKHGDADFPIQYFVDELSPLLPCLFAEISRKLSDELQIRQG